MGMDLIYKCENNKITIRFSINDWETINVIKDHLPKAIALMVNTPDFGVPLMVNRLELIEAVEKIANLLEEKPELLPYTYQFKYDHIPGTDVKADCFSSGGMYGFHMPGDNVYTYGISAGMNKCVLEKCKVVIVSNDQGKPVESKLFEERDIRNLTELHTADAGLICIRKRRAKTRIQKELKTIHEFLVSLSNSEIEKILC